MHRSQASRSPCCNRSHLVRSECALERSARPDGDRSVRSAPAVRAIRETADGEFGEEQLEPQGSPASSELEETQLEKSILRRGLATAAEIEACKTHRKQLAAKAGEQSKSLLEIMVDAKVLTRSQMTRLVQESGEANRNFRSPATR